MPSLYLRLGAYALAVALCIAGGWYLGGLAPKRALAQLQAADWQAKAQATQVALTAVQNQLAAFQAVSANNVTVIQDLQNDNAKIAADRDANLQLAHRLLNLAKAPAAPGGGDVPKAGNLTPVAGSTSNPGAGPLESLVADVADESAQCALTYNALLSQLKPQL